MSGCARMARNAKRRFRPQPMRRGKALRPISRERLPSEWNETEKGVHNVPTQEEIKIVAKATLYDLRLIFTNGEKDQYTREEIVELLDKIAIAKDQE